MALALKFFLGQNQATQESDSESEEEGPSARDIIMRWAFSIVVYLLFANFWVKQAAVLRFLEVLM